VPILHAKQHGTWVPAIGADGQPRDGAQACEITGLLPGESYTRPGPDTPPGHGSTQYLEARHRAHATAARLRGRAYVVAAMVGSLSYAHFARVEVGPDCGCGGVWYGVIAVASDASRAEASLHCARWADGPREQGACRGR
jgi:hypothetical protein